MSISTGSIRSESGSPKDAESEAPLIPHGRLIPFVVVTALFFGGFMRYDPAAPHDPHRDRFILSKGHAVPVLYSALAEAGFFPVDELLTLRKLGSPLEGHPVMGRVPGIEASTGSLHESRGLTQGRVFSEDGALVASVAQEVFLRRPRPA